MGILQAKKETPMKFRVDIEKPVKAFLKRRKGELQEETGAIRFDMKPLCVYSVTGKTRVNDTGEESFGPALLCGDNRICDRTA